MAAWEEFCCAHITFIYITHVIVAQKQTLEICISALCLASRGLIRTTCEHSAAELTGRGDVNDMEPLFLLRNAQREGKQ